MSRARTQHGMGISLFPCLAVLICTMGALIVLLIVVARVSRIQAAQTAGHDSADVKADKELLEVRITQLQASRQKTAAQLEEERLKLSGVEDHLRRLREQFARLKESAAELERGSDPNGAQRQATAAELARLQTAIAQSQQDLEAARREAQDRPAGSYAIIPYVGPNKTRRQPFYVECTAEAIILQPEGIRLTERDFPDPSYSGNPLAVAVRAAREYIAEHDPGGLQDGGEPYPLLLVRPDGIGAYYIAREAMSGWGSDFGYELIGADWPLEFPQPDPLLAESQQRAVDEARSRQQMLVNIAPPRRQEREERPTYTVSSSGGLVRDGGPSIYDSGRPMSDLEGRGPGGRGGSGFGSGRGGSGSGRPGSGGGNGSDSALADGGYGGGAGGNSAFGPPGVGGPAGSSTFGTPGPGGNDPGANGNSGNSVGANGAGGGGFGAGGTGGNGFGAGGTGQPGSPSGSSSPGSSSSGSSGPSGSGGAPSSGFGLGGGSPNKPGGDPRGAGGANGKAVAGAASGSAGGTPISRGEAIANGWDMGGSQSGVGAQGVPSGMPSGNPSAGDPLLQTIPGDNGQQGPPLFTPSGANDPAAKNKKRSLAETRGTNWALGNPGPRAVPVTRPIRVRCEGERLLVMADPSGNNPRVIILPRRTEDAIDQLVGVMRTEMKNWGMAGNGMYWRPLLVLELGESGEGRIADLQALLHDSGFDVKRK